MRFWDASAITPLLVAEGASEAMRELLRDDESIAVWWGARVECASALRRREREGALPASSVRRSLDLLDDLAAAWSEILPRELVRLRAERALAVHSLRAADAFQLAAALTWRSDVTARGEFVCLDERLRDAGSREGLVALPDSLEGIA